MLGANVFFYFGAFVIAGIMLFGAEPVQAADAATAAGNAAGLDISPPHWQPVYPVWAEELQ